MEMALILLDSATLPVFEVQVDSGGYHDPDAPPSQQLQ